MEQEILLIEKKYGIEPGSITGQLKDEILILEGEVNSWGKIVDACHAAAKLPGVRNVVNHIRVPEMVEKPQVNLLPYRSKGVIANVDVVIIGGGVSGCGIARELSKYEGDILVVEKASDICEGTTKSNNGMIHSGYDTKPGSLKARLGVKGNALYSKWAEELQFQFKRTGSFVCGFDAADMETIQSLYENGVKNEVPGVEVITGDRAREIEPNLSDEIIGALWTPTAGYVEPYEVALALAENAVDNGTKFLLDTEVLEVLKSEDTVYGVVTNRGIIHTRVVINAAGLYADEIAKMAGDECYSIHPRRGTLAILDKENKGKLHTFAGKAPSNYTKGGGPQETPEGTLIWGPSAKEVIDKEDLSVDQDDLKFILDKGLELTKNIATDSVITYFSGNRAATFNEDFVIENSKVVKGLIHVAGIQSPGLAASPAIAQYVEALYLEQRPDTVLKEDYNPIRLPEKPMRECNDLERMIKIQKNPLYGKVVCRCETVTEGEIVDAIHGKIPARTVDAIKRRTRAGMGRCQSGFCGSRVLEILSRELGISKSEITLKGQGSEILMKPTRMSLGGK